MCPLFGVSIIKGSTRDEIHSLQKMLYTIDITAIAKLLQILIWGPGECFKS